MLRVPPESLPRVLPSSGNPLLDSRPLSAGRVASAADRPADDDAGIGVGGVEKWRHHKLRFWSTLGKHILLSREESIGIPPIIICRA